jgi:phosphotriesterase-related protein
MPSSNISSELSRREVLALAAAPLAAAPLPAMQPSVLVQEHVLVDFTGAGKWDSDEAFRAAKPKLDEVARLGCRRFLECTPAFLGRDPKLLARLADATGIEIWTNTGIYGAAEQKFVPAFAREETAERLAARWVREASEGAGGMRPRFIKTGVSRGPLDELDRKLVRAAAMASRETGLPVASHTPNGAAAVEQLDILVAEKVAPAKFVWVHAQNEKDHAVHEKKARAGAWVGFDGVNAKSAEWHLDCVRFMAAKGLLGRVLISQDSGWYRVGQPGGGDFRPYTYIYTDFLPKLEAAWRGRLMWDNPRLCFGR